MTTQTSRLVIEIDSRNAERNTRAVANELENLTTKGYKADAQMTEMSGSIKTLVGFMGGLLTINKAIAMADGYTQMAARIRNATSSAEEYDLVQNRVLATANTTYRSLSEAQEVYLSLSGGMKSLGKTTTQTLDLVDSLSFSFTHNATRTDQAQSAMDSLSKSMAKGKIDADAWISIVTGADNIIADMAKTTGKTEAEIRKLGAEGKASLEDLIKTLIATREQNEKLANNMENSLADGFTSLSNAVTVYLGKANESTSATGIMAGALGELAQNLESVANVAMLGGVAYLTKTILAQTVAIRGSVTESLKKNAANLSEIGTNAALTASEARKTGAIAQYTAMQLVDAKATAARMTGLQRLTYIQATVIPLEAKATQATAAHTAATAADTIAQEANNKARSRAAALYNLIGGPIGAITIGITALAAGYMYFSSRAAEANAKLEEQAAVAKKAKEELLALKGLEKDDAIDKMTASFERQNKALSESSSKINMQLNAIEQLYKGNKEVVQVVQDARNGTISMTEAVQRFNELRISKEVYESVKANTVEFEKNAKEATNTKTKLSLFGFEVELSGRKAQTSIAGVDGNTKALKENKTAANSAAEAQKNFKASLFDREFEAKLTKGLLAKGYTPEQVANMVQTANWAQKNSVKLTNDMYQAGLQVLSIEQQNNKVIESRNKALKENTSELSKQQKVIQASAAVQANAAKFNFSGIESKYNLPKGTLSALHAIETGNTGKTNQVNKQTGATGGFQFLSGTAKQYGVDDRTNLGQSAEGAGKYMAYLLKLFKGDLEKAVRAYHAGEGNVQKGTNIGKYNNDYWKKYQGYMAGSNGYSAGDITAKDFNRMLEESAKLLEEQANSRKALELEVATEVTRIRENLKDKLLDIDKAGFSPERTKELIAEYQSRADNDIAIAEYALKTKLDDYSSFKKTEDELLKDSIDQKKFYAARDIELSIGQRDQAIKYLDEEYLHELGLIKLAKEQRIFQAEQAMMTEVQYMQKRYALEREEIIRTTNDLEERKRKLDALNTNIIRGGVGKNFSDPEDSSSQFLQSMNYAEKPQTNLERLNEENDKVLQKLKDNLNAVKEAENTSYEERLEAERVFTEAKQQLSDEYYFKAQDARKLDHNEQLQLYGQLLSQTSTVWGDMTQMVKDAKGENSRTYRAMFYMQKEMAVAQQIINTELAASSTTAQTGIFGLPAAAVIRATGYAGVALIKAQQFMGTFSDGGFTGIGGKFDPAGIVHKGEVVWSQEDIKRWGGVNVVEAMRTSQPPKGYSDGGFVTPKDTYRVGMGTVDAVQASQAAIKEVTVAPKITINTLPGQTANVTTGSDGSVTIDVVEKWFRDSLQNPNSTVRKGLAQNTTATARR
jgi:tape measure domain-containing protein